MLALLELGGGSPWVLHAIGLLLLGGRCVHAWAIIRASFVARTIGMGLTFTSCGLLVLGNLLVHLG